MSVRSAVSTMLEPPSIAVNRKLLAQLWSTIVSLISVKLTLELATTMAKIHEFHPLHNRAQFSW